MKLSTLAALACLTTVVPGCAHYPLNAKLEKYESPYAASRAAINSPNRSEDLLLVVSFSGGGTRAATLGYGVLEALARVEVPGPSSAGTQAGGRPVRHLVDEVDVVTGVSGGSVIAASYALRGRQIFPDFKEQFLNRNVTWGLIGRGLNPINWFRLASVYFSRTDLEAEYFDDLLFHGATYKDHDPLKGPDLVVQATDIVDGYYFSFSRMHFGIICSNLSSYPLARAVAASASLPGPFTAITLRNYAGQCGYQEEPWMTAALAKRDLTSRSYRFSKQLQSYQNWEDKPYIHLVDGGISDNFGVRGYLDVLGTGQHLRNTLTQRGLEKVKRIAFIVVNAETKQSTKRWSMLEETPDIVSIQDVSFTAMINSLNFESMELLRRMVKDWSEETLEEGGLYAA